MVTASHNPIDYNGIKMVREGARPISSDTGLADIKQLAEANAFQNVALQGRVETRDPRPNYVDHVCGYVAPEGLKPLKIVVNAGNGAAGPTFDAIAAQLDLPWTFERLHHTPDGSFPNGIPNPLLPENRSSTAQAVRAQGGDLGVAWDGDFDRCFFFDETGAFLDGEYVVALLAAAFCAKEDDARIVHDPRVIWSTLAEVAKSGGHAIASRVGHSHIKKVMRDHDAARSFRLRERSISKWATNPRQLLRLKPPTGPWRSHRIGLTVSVSIWAHGAPMFVRLTPNQCCASMWKRAGIAAY